MTFFTLFHSSRRMCLGILFAISCMAGTLAQSSITVTDLGNYKYKIGTTNLNNEDLVFYRFSDGYEMTAMSSSSNPQAAVQRSFRVTNARVSGFIARKGGGVNLAVGDISNPVDCIPCPVPSVNLPNGEYIRLRTPSWSPSVDPAAPQVLVDTKCSPTCYTPNIPWFIIPVTIKTPSANCYSIISVPNGMTIVGAFVKSTWRPVAVGQNTFTISDPDVASFQYSSSTSFRINMTASFNNDFNVYLLVSSTTQEGTLSSFCTQMYDSNGQQVGPYACTRYLTQHNPHDPNLLTAYQRSLCWASNIAQDLTYRVDFQNIGAADAHMVNVQVNFDLSKVDISNVTSVTSSHAWMPLQSMSPNTVAFQFPNIYLKGVNQDPQPLLDETKGWIEFTVKSKPCLPVSTLVTSGSVRFMAPPSFDETLLTNNTTQFISVDYSCGPKSECGGHTLKTGGTETEQVLVPKCYPTLFSDALTVEAPASEESNTLNLLMSDMTGRIWIKKSYQTAPDADFMDTLDTSELPGGVYIVQIRQGSKTDKFKVIKE